MEPTEDTLEAWKKDQKFQGKQRNEILICFLKLHPVHPTCRFERNKKHAHKGGGDDDEDHDDEDDDSDDGNNKMKKGKWDANENEEEYKDGHKE
ncbi:Mediator of RNA polymerase II transcription subunit 32 isoform C [Glycine soja]|uniref:Mediator of RNA polymerase II transcription subunit 32 isoform C n=1 Tax=Glycine soja TaxID=3848 RepID=A0A445KZ81_GLYSO|nr:Mediator of RNA polymerase II transcription subunit 32 isoform C [Glycine soja]